MIRPSSCLDQLMDRSDVGTQRDKHVCMSSTSTSKLCWLSKCLPRETCLQVQDQSRLLSSGTNCQVLETLRFSVILTMWFAWSSPTTCGIYSVPVWTQPSDCGALLQETVFV